ncbi:putative metallopeptidase [Gottschalkia acidurici 9a]|uniref:Metallopeptidase n=1 Tax=Gottschalkia acidurici (strain ATCC 7906 / DSM 604 / BCRC 14475 / CIP 104303 / KCTC 5404 / NCIMB 10678 / 9a) TaxID=1128398 RepID=K0AY31_GOTA9|nr:VWA-like domain-containing protein [Gottschalkia acidurici]AFS77682.1 putative metallopeptidase [Gottschalkia acidurici 9a]
MGEIMTVEEKFIRARIVLLKGDPFIGKYLLLLDKPIECGGDNSKNDYSALANLKTMATTGTKLYYNREYVDKLSFKQFLFAILHQMLHCIAMHPARGIERNDKIWNMASDLWVNDRLKRKQLEYKESRDIDYEPYDDELFSDNNRIPDMSVDDIYEELMDQYKEQIESRKQSQQNNASFEDGSEQNNGDNSSQGKMDDSITLKSGSKTFNLGEYNPDIIKPENVGESSADLIKEMSEMSASANVHSQLSGIGTELLSEQEIGMQRAETKWYIYFDRFLKKLYRYDTSYSTPEKSLLYTRRIYKGPSKTTSYKLNSIIIAMDCSASVWSDQDAMEKFWFHINNIMRKYKAEGRVLLWDGEVGVDLDLSKFKPNGEYELPRGGTRPTSVYEYIYKNKIKYELLVMLTDAYFIKRELVSIAKNDDKKTIWVVSGKHEAYKKLGDYAKKARVCKLG